ENFNRRELFPFKELEESATSGGDVGNPISDSVFRHRRQGIAAARNGKRWRRSDGAGQRLGALAELVEFEDADRPVPDDGSGLLHDVGELRGGRRAYI